MNLIRYLSAPQHERDASRQKLNSALIEKTFWLYYGKDLVTAVRCKPDATDDEVRKRALEVHAAVPLVTARWPDAAPATVETLIRQSTVMVAQGPNPDP